MSSIDPISKTDDILFECEPDSGCRNLCCCGINQTLTGYDILKLSRLKGMTTESFLKKYTFSYTGKQTKIPVVSLFEQPDKDNACIFLEKSCTVYDARPLSCRLYPVARGISKDKRTGRLIEHFAVINEDQCTGFGKGTTMAVSDWLIDQRASDYIDASDYFMTFILDLTAKSIELDKTQKNIFIKGCYNLDLFFQEIKSLKIELATDLKSLEENPLLLFKAGVEWTRSQLLKN